MLAGIFHPFAEMMLVFQTEGYPGRNTVEVVGSALVLAKCHFIVLQMCSGR